MREIERRARQVDSILARPVSVAGERSTAGPVSADALEAVCAGSATLPEYALVCRDAIEAYRLSCLAFAPLFVAALQCGFRVHDDRVAIAYPPDVRAPLAESLSFQQRLATASVEQRRAFAGLNPERAARVSATRRRNAAIVMLVLGDAQATAFRTRLWTKAKDQWSIDRPTWAPSELTSLPPDAYEAAVQFDGCLMTAVSNGWLQESRFRLDIQKVVQAMLGQKWEGPEKIPA